MRRSRTRLYVEVVLASSSAILLALTLVYPNWIERIFDVDPDAGSGELEWVIALGALVSTLVFGIAARREWRLVRRLMPPDPANPDLRVANVRRPAFDGPTDVVRELTRLVRAGDLVRPRVPPPAGEVLEPIRITGDVVGTLSANAARRALGAAAAARTNTEVVWSDGGDELAVDPAQVKVNTTAGAIAVVIPVRCDETGPATVEVAFAVGAPDRPAGLYAATEERPRGPAVIVDRWADALIAFAWSAVLELAGSLAGTLGRDAHGDKLIAGALVATDDGLEVVPVARHRLGRLQA